jgi:hypothetical protein
MRLSSTESERGSNVLRTCFGLQCENQGEYEDFEVAAFPSIPMAFGCDHAEAEGRVVVTRRLRGMLEGGLRHNIVVYKRSNRDRPD